MKRRFFIFSAATFSIVGSGGAYWWGRRNSNVSLTETGNDAEPAKAKARFIQAIQEKLNYLELDRTALTQYQIEIEKIFGRIPELRKNETAETFASHFLLCTNFFIDGEDTSKKIRFVTFYDPYISPCFNPVMQMKS